MELLSITAYKLAQELGISSTSTEYHVANGRNNLSTNLIERIVRRYPNINYIYLKNGKGEPLLLTESEGVAQRNLLDGTIEIEQKEPSTYPTEKESLFLHQRWM